MSDQLIKVFKQEGDFSACDAAERFCKELGLSVGTMQRRDPRGLMFGDIDIEKWRNLSDQERKALHGIMTGYMRDGPVTVTVFDSAPASVKDAMRLVATP